MEVFLLVTIDFPNKDKRTKAITSLMFLKEKKGPLSKGKNVHQRTKTERGLDKTGHDIPSSKRTKHIKVKYFFFKARSTKGKSPLNIAGWTNVDRHQC
jgi:hypothetical protein